MKDRRPEWSLDKCLGFQKALERKAHKMEVAAQTETYKERKLGVLALKLFLSSL